MKPSDLCNDLWCPKTRVMGLSDGERISMIRSAILIHYTRVTDRQTDGQTELAWHIYAIAYMLSRVKTDMAKVISGPCMSQSALAMAIVPYT